MNCPTCGGPIIDGLCCNGTPKECLQKWWNEHGHEPRPVYEAEELEQYRDFVSGTQFQSFRERLAAIEARAQATDAALQERINKLEEVMADVRTEVHFRAEITARIVNVERATVPRIA